MTVRKIDINRRLKEVGANYLICDIEGGELEALRSNDWQRFRPKLVIVEWRAPPLDLMGSWQAGGALPYLQEQGYRLVGRTANSWFFLERGFKAASEIDAP